MPELSGPRVDQTLGLALDGYAWLPALWRRSGGAVAHTRIMGQRAVALRGPQAVRFFYDEAHVRRHTAIPELVRGTLFGHGAIHTLDGEHHRHRKAMHLSVVKDDPYRVADLTERVVAAWDRAAGGWAGQERVVLFDEASRAITRGVCDWAGVPLDDEDVPSVAADLTALVDGFATLGRRHWRARRARGRRQRWLATLVRQVRAGTTTVPAGSAVQVVAEHVDVDGRPLRPKGGAVELLNILRPTVAVSWFVAFAGHALHRWPQCRERLRDDDMAYAVAFTHELRRFYPFAPFVGGRAVKNLTWQGERIPAGSLVLLDIYGQNHDAALWPEPYRFDPRRFLDRVPDPDELIPQGGGDPRTGHRCPGEDITVTLLAALATRLARLDYDVPEQDLTISLRRIPAMVRSRVVIDTVRTPVTEPGRAAQSST